MFKKFHLGVITFFIKIENQKQLSFYDRIYVRGATDPKENEKT